MMTFLYSQCNLKYKIDFIPSVSVKPPHHSPKEKLQTVAHSTRRTHLFGVSSRLLFREALGLADPVEEFSTLHVLHDE